MNNIRLALLVMIFYCLPAATLLRAEEKWQGIDETVVQKIAREHGREASKPLIDTSEGDIQLFAFLVAGVVGGFGMGYYWRVLLEGRKESGGNTK